MLEVSLLGLEWLVNQKVCVVQEKWFPVRGGLLNELGRLIGKEIAQVLIGWMSSLRIRFESEVFPVAFDSHVESAVCRVLVLAA